MARATASRMLGAMGKRLLLIDGHPDPHQGRFIHALAQAYEEGARAGGHAVRRIKVGELQFPLLVSGEDFEHGEPPDAILAAQEEVRWAEHIVILYPLWLGSMPALLKGFFEQLLRPGFGFSAGATKGLPGKLLKGKSARVVITMGMPAAFYSVVYRAHSLRALKRNILAFCGIRPVRTSLIGMVGGSAARRTRWIAEMEKLGRRAA
jgi:putative NADPH-quinone reductase